MSHLLSTGQEEDVAIDTISWVSLGIPSYHGKQTLLGFCRAQQDSVESMSHHQLPVCEGVRV